VEVAHDVSHGAWLSHRWRKVNGYAGIDRVNDVRFQPIVSSLPRNFIAIDAQRFLAAAPGINQRNS
jgi:hypothetical protein